MVACSECNGETEELVTIGFRENGLCPVCFARRLTPGNLHPDIVHSMIKQILSALSSMNESGIIPSDPIKRREPIQWLGFESPRPFVSSSGRNRSPESSQIGHIRMDYSHHGEYPGHTDSRSPERDPGRLTSSRAGFIGGPVIDEDVSQWRLGGKQSF